MLLDKLSIGGDVADKTEFDIIGFDIIEFDIIEFDILKFDDEF